MVSFSSAIAEDEVVLQFLSFPKNAQPDNLELRIGENQTHKIEAPSNRISQDYKIPKMKNKMKKWTIGTSEHIDAKSAFKAQGEAPALDSNQQLNLILFGEDNGTEQVKIIPIDTSASGFSGGRHLLVNHSPDLISGAIGGQEFSLQDGEHAILEPEAAPSPTSSRRATAGVSIHSGNEKQPFFSSTWRINPKARSIVFFYQDPETQHLRLHSIRDYL